MKRRDFLRTSFAAAVALYGATQLPLMADDISGAEKRFLANIVLDGGLDIRQLLSPQYSEEIGTFGYTYWSSRLTIYKVSTLSELKPLYDELYDEIEFDGERFAILKSAGWLKDAILSGDVAIINNMGLTNSYRDHNSGLVTLESGADHIKQGGSGWGGRLAKALGTQVSSLSPYIRQFCHGESITGSHWEHDNSEVLSLPDTRELGVYKFTKEMLATHEGEPAYWVYKMHLRLSRTIHGYYQAKNPTLPADSPMKKITNAYSQSMKNAEVLKERLANYPRNDEFLKYDSIGKQFANLHDALVCEDLLNTKISSLEILGCDSHKDQLGYNNLFEDLFGNGGDYKSGLFTLLQSELIKNGESEKFNSTIFLMAGEFGRQLMANGSAGTDHGYGNTVLLIGKNIKGGVYGDMFPEDEIPNYSKVGGEIEVKEDIYRLFGEICNYMGADGEDIITGYSSRKGTLDLSKIFKTI